MHLAPRSHLVLPRSLLLAGFLMYASALAAENLPQAQHIATGGSKAQIDAGVLATRRYAAFWNTGNEAYGRAALSPNFIDRTLPAGRPQGIAGPLQASKAFRAAVPDLRAELVQLVVAGDRVSAQYRFTGHFTGIFGSAAGHGQAIDFIAFDLYRIERGQIAENWHLEDNLGLMQQLGIVK